MTNPFRYFNSSAEVIRLVVMMYVKYPLSLRNVEDLRLSAVSTSAMRRSGFGGTGRPDVRRRDSKEAGSAHGWLSSVAVAPGRGLREGQRQALLSLARRRSRRRGLVVSGQAFSATAHKQWARGCLSRVEGQLPMRRFSSQPRVRTAIRRSRGQRRREASQPKSKFSRAPDADGRAFLAYPAKPGPAAPRSLTAQVEIFPSAGRRRASVPCALPVSFVVARLTAPWISAASSVRRA